MIKAQHPAVTNLHFFGDGPTTQYRQKGNFFLLSTEPSLKGFENVTWSFFEASHCKGAPDGIGGSLKRQADTLARQGQDIEDAEVFYRKVKKAGTSVKLFFIGEDEVTALAERMENVPLLPIKGTMNVHQVISTTPGTVKYRDISCFCQLAKGVWDCPCYELQEATFMMEENTAEKNNASVPSRPDVIGNHHCGQWCVLSYDEDLYPGVILDVEEHNIKIKCMQEWHQQVLLARPKGGCQLV